MRRKQKIGRAAALGLVLAACAVLLWMGLRKAPPDPETAPRETGETVLPPSPSPEDGDAGKLRISELMVRNKAVLPDEDGDFPDWIELENISGETVDLAGWRLAEEGKDGWTFPETRLQPGERLLIFASGKDRPGHCSFSLSAGETLCLYTPAGSPADRVLCPEGETDRAWIPDGSGGCTESLYPTPGYPNTPEGYGEWMASLAGDSPLVIYEVATYNASDRWKGTLGDSDWVELKNVSDENVDLSDFYLSDRENERLLFQLPARTLGPGEIYLIRCDDNNPNWGLAPVCPAFSLDSTADQLYLSRADGSLADYAFLRDIPFEGSYGRMQGENGWFFFAAPTPGAENGEGKRRVSAAPTAAEPDGVFNGVEGVTVTLQAGGEIRYTLDSSYPTALSPLYEEPIRLESTGVVRAVAQEEDALPSRALTLSYIINEDHSLPIVSLVSDNYLFRWMYNGSKKGLEVTGNLSFYEENGSFSLPCGIKMHGDTSLSMPKKNMSIRFRGAYGQDELHYDIFGGGVTDFTNLLLRSGQDYFHAIIRNELCTELALSATDRVVTSRSRYCVLYIDGQYWGIYALGEKLNEAMYAHLAGVSRDSVTVETPPLYQASHMYQEVFAFAEANDLSLSENYAVICSRLDVDSLIDWLILEGVFANDDLTFGNVRYCRSTENDGKWRLMFYDLDSTLYSEEKCFGNLISPWARSEIQISQLLGKLLQNSEFRAKLLIRANELIRGPLANERILEEIDLLAAQVEPEVKRDYARYQLHQDAWEWNVEWLRQAIAEKDWNRVCIDKLCYYLQVSAEERAQYFGG